MVAEEVRQLASKSSESAKSAAQMVGSTKTIIESGVKLTGAATMLPSFTMMVIYSLQPWLYSAAWAV